MNTTTRFPSSFLWLLLVTSPTAAQAIQQKTDGAATLKYLDVPVGREPVLDGKMGVEEWSDAVVLAQAQAGTADAVELVAKHRAGTLYLGVRRQRTGITTIGVARGERILVLHASASLGTAEYRAGKGSWDMVSGFEWRCSDTAAAETQRTERREHMAKHGWLASTMKMGLGQAEFALAAPLVSGAQGEPQALRIALSLMGGAPLRVPQGLADGLTNMQLQMGNSPPTLQFAPDDWVVVRLAPAAVPLSPAPASTPPEVKDRLLPASLRPAVESLAGLQCYDIAGTWVFADASTDVDGIAADMTAAAAAFEAHFSRRPRRGAVILGSGSVPTGAAQRLCDAGAAWIMPWVSSEALALDENKIRKQVEQQLRKKLEPLGLSDAQIESYVEQAIAQVAGSTTRGGAGLLRHELGHLWFIDAFWPRPTTKAPTPVVIDEPAPYGGPAADWLDETAAILLESDALAARRRTAFRSSLRQDPTRFIPLGDLFTMPHKHARGPRDPSAPREPGPSTGADQTPEIEVLVETTDGGGSDDEPFYEQCRVLADYLILRGGKGVFAALATDAAAGGSMQSWLTENGAACGLPATIDGLQSAWLEWCRR